MLTQEENDLLTRVGPGTPLNALLRRYWLPACLSEEIAEPGGAPARVQLLGERLVAFRDPDGQVGLLREFCPHRGASLVYGRNEADGLRCIYHGWKIGCRGDILDAPPEPPGSPFLHSIHHPAYPTHEVAGMVWAYLGPPAEQPPFPEFPWTRLSAGHVLPVKMFQFCSYLQGVEGDFDPSHPNYLHRDFLDAEAWRGAGWESIALLMNDGAPQVLVEDTDYGFRAAGLRQTGDPTTTYARVYEVVAPFYTYVPSGPHESQLIKAWQPVDDEHCFTYYIHFDPAQPLDPEAIYRNWNHRCPPPDYIPSGLNVANRHGQDRAAMQTRSMSGIAGAAIQDLALQESMLPIIDRTQEHLGTSDVAVIHLRRFLLRCIRDLQAGCAELPGTHIGAGAAAIRSASLVMPLSTPWREAARLQAAAEREPTPAV